MTSTFRQINMDYSLCKALSYHMEDIPVALVMYDIMCQYGVHFQERVERSPELTVSSSLELRTGIGLFHIHGHQDSCLPRYSPSYIPGAKQVDGEIIETLWAPLNNVSRSIRGMSLVHRQEVLDAHMNHSNWKKLVHIGMWYLHLSLIHIYDIEDDEEQAAIPETHGQGNVCPQMASYILTSDCLQTPMDQWIHVRNRYLHLLLEMEGVTKAPKCSLCKEAMAVKCGDCIGGNYFCVSCCLQAHKRSPFHRLFHWTGAHFSPISLYSLGFKLCLEHDGEPCPFTVDVRCVTVPYIRIILTWKQGIRTAQQSLPTKRTSRTEPPSGGQRHPSSIPARDSLGIADTLFDLDDFGKRAPHRVRTSASGNPLVTVVHQSGVFNMEVLFCICPNAGTRDEQLLHAGLFPSSLKQIETAFTFSCLLYTSRCV